MDAAVVVTGVDEVVHVADLGILAQLWIVVRRAGQRHVAQGTALDAGREDARADQPVSVCRRAQPTSVVEEERSDVSRPSLALRPMSSTVELIRSESLAPAVQYAYAAIAPVGSRIVFLAGACPLNTQGRVIAPGSYEGQTTAAFNNMVTALADSGAVVTDVVSTRLLVASSRQEDLREAWTVFRAAMGEHDAPSTLMGVTALGYPDQLVEIEAVAAIPSE